MLIAGKYPAVTMLMSAFHWSRADAGAFSREAPGASACHMLPVAGAPVSGRLVTRPAASTPGTPLTAAIRSSTAR